MSTAATTADALRRNANIEHSTVLLMLWDTKYDRIMRVVLPYVDNNVQSAKELVAELRAVL